MIKIIIKILGIVILAILQLSFFSKLSIWGSVPNVILIFAIALTLKNRFSDGLLIAAIGGVMLDLASPLRFGIYAFTIVGIILLIRFVVLKFLPTTDYLVSCLIFVGSFILLDLVLSLMILSWPGWLVATNSLVNGLWGIIIYRIVQKIVPPEKEIKII